MTLQIPRAMGANTQLALAFEASYGRIPEDGYHLVAFSSEDLGEEQQLVASDLLGRGRLPSKPAEGPVDNRGTIVVPVDPDLFGLWLKLLFGAPQTTRGLAAKGSITFAANPANNDTVTIAGQAFTFKAAPAAANQILIGASLTETMRNAVWSLNQSAVVAVAAASYGVDEDFGAITITHDTIGTVGNAFTIAASVAVASGATLSGGVLAAGPYNHVFRAGARSLPTATIEVCQTDVGLNSANYGVMIDTLSIGQARTGLLNANLGYIAKGERASTPDPVSGELEAGDVERFSQFSGAIEMMGVPLGSVVSAQVQLANGYEIDDGIYRGGRIGGGNPGAMTINPQFVVRFGDPALQALAQAGESVAISWGWVQGDNSLTFKHLAVRLPKKPKRPVNGPGFVQATFDTLAHQDDNGQALEVVLVNNVPDYD